MSSPASQLISADPGPSLLELFRIWLRIGATSFGGGSATQLMIQDAFVSRRGWMTAEEFAQDWAIVQFAPGINLLAMAVVIGRRFGGAAGVIASVLGMLGPAAAITVAMTALYVRVRDVPAVAGALRGITPALVGLSIAFMWRLLRGPMAGLRARGWAALLLGVALIVTTGALTAFGVPVLASYAIGAISLGIAYAMWSRSRPGSNP